MGDRRQALSHSAWNNIIYPKSKQAKINPKKAVTKFDKGNQLLQGGNSRELTASTAPQIAN